MAVRYQDIVQHGHVLPGQGIHEEIAVLFPGQAQPVYPEQRLNAALDILP